MSSKAILLAACLALGSTGLAMAHHSNAAYDSDHPQTVEGTVKQVNWTNPHITFVVETDAKDGPQAGTWVFEVSSPGVLSRCACDPWWQTTHYRCRRHRGRRRQPARRKSR